MSDRTDYFTGQLVTQQDLDMGFTFLEQAVWNVVADLGFNGIVVGFSAAQNTPTGMSLVAGAGRGYSDEGKRLYIIDPTTVVDMTVDRNGDDTAVLTPGAERWVSIIITPDRDLQDTRPDANNFPVSFQRLEKAKFEVIMGGEGLPATRPTVPDESILLCDVLLTDSTTSILDADIDTTRVVYFSSYEYNSTVYTHETIRETMQAAIDLLASHESSGTHPWTVITTEQTNGVWANGNNWLPTPPANVNLAVALETWLVNALASSDTTSGAHRLGCYLSTYQSGAGVPIIAAGTLFARLEAMRDATNIYMPALPAWPGGDNPTNPATSVLTSLTKLVNNIGASSSQTDQGIRRIGVHGTGYALASWSALGATTIHSVFNGLNSTGATDGASYIAAKVSGNLAAGTVRTQLDELDDADDALDVRVTAIENALGEEFYMPPVASSMSPSYSNSSTSFTSIALALFAPPITEGVEIGDIIEIRANCTIDAGSGTDGLVALFVEEDGGAAGGTEIPGARVKIAGNTEVPVSLTATHEVTAAGGLLVYLKGRVKVFTGGSISATEAYRLELLRLRAPSP